MKITARVTFSKSEERASLVQAFFGESDFSPKNILRILDDETAFIHLEFEDKPPQAIIQALSQCKIEYMDNLETSDIWDLMTDHDYNNHKEVVGNPEVANQIVEETHEDDEVTDSNGEEKEEIGTVEKQEQIIPNSDSKETLEVIEAPVDEVRVLNNSEPESVVEKQKKKAKKRRFGLQKPSEDDYLEIPELITIAASATNFSEYVAEVGKWLELPVDETDYFVKLTTDLSELDKKPYEICNEDVKKINLDISHHDFKRVKFAKLLTTLLENKSYEDATFLLFMCTVIRHGKEINGTSCRENSDAEKSDDGPPAATVVENEAEKKSDEINYLSCIEFVELLSSIDTELPAIDKAKILISKMGLENESPSLYKDTCEVVSAAFSMENLDSIDSVMLQAGFDVSTSKGMKLKCKLADWINKYNKENHVKRMKIISFLREIKAIFTSK